MSMNAKSSRSALLAAMAVLAVAFVVLAAIPAADAEDATATNPTEITDFTGFTTALTNGGNYVLKNNIDGTINADTTVSKNLSIDLNGKTITLTGGKTITASGCTLEFKSTGEKGSLKYTGFTYTTIATLSADKDAALTLDNVKFETDGSAVYPFGDASKATVKNSEIVAGGYAVGTNNAKTGTNKVSIEIENSTLTTNGEYNGSKDNATVMINVQDVTLSIKGSVLTGDRQTLFVRAGTATVENTEINFNDAFTGELKDGKWLSGNDVASAAVVVGDKDNDSAYEGTAKLTIKGGEIKAASGTAVITSTDKNTSCELIIGNEAATKVTIGNNSVSVTGIKATEAGFSISEGSVIITGSMTAADANAEIAQAGGDVVLKDLTITSGTLTIDKSVGVQGDLTVSQSAILNLADEAVLTVIKGSSITNDGTITNGGTITNEGTVTNNGTITNNGSFYSLSAVKGVDVYPYTIDSNDLEYTGSSLGPSAVFKYDKAVWEEVYVIGTYLYMPGTDKLESLDTNYRTDVGEYRACIFLNYTEKDTGDVRTNMKLDFIWKITAADIADATIEEIPNQNYTGEEVTPDVKISYNGIALVEGKDFDLKFDNNTEQGQATVTITGKGNFTGTVTKTFYIIDMQKYLDELEKWMGGSEGLGKTVPGSDITYAQAEYIYNAIVGAYNGLYSATTPDELDAALADGKLKILLATKEWIRDCLKTVYAYNDELKGPNGYWGLYMTTEVYNQTIADLSPEGIAYTPSIAVSVYEDALAKRTALPIDDLMAELNAWIGGNPGLGQTVPGSDLTFTEIPSIRGPIDAAYQNLAGAKTLTEARDTLASDEIIILKATKEYVGFLLDTMYNDGKAYYGWVMSKETYDDAKEQISPSGWRCNPTDVVGVLDWAMSQRQHAETATFYVDGEILDTIDYKYDGTTAVDIHAEVDALNPTRAGSDLIKYTFDKWVDADGKEIDFTKVKESFSAYATFTSEINGEAKLLGDDVWFGYMFSDEYANAYNDTLPWFTVNYQRLYDDVAVQFYIDDVPALAEPFVGKANVAAYLLLGIGNEIMPGNHTVKIVATFETIEQTLEFKVNVIDYVQVKFLDADKQIDVQYPVNGTAIELPALEDKDGMKFAGWYNGDEFVGAAGSAYTVSGKATLTAKFVEDTPVEPEKLTVTFTGANADGTDKIVTGAAGDIVGVAIYRGEVAEGKSFIGWTLEGLSYVAYPIGGTIVLEESFVLVPVFQDDAPVLDDRTVRQQGDYELYCAPNADKDKLLVYIVASKDTSDVDKYRNALSETKINAVSKSASVAMEMYLNDCMGYLDDGRLIVAVYELDLPQENTYIKAFGWFADHWFTIGSEKVKGYVPTGVTVDPAEIGMDVGEERTITATVVPATALDQTVTWTSSDEKVATVDENGNVVAVGIGTAMITATTVNGKTAQCTVSVKDLDHIEVVAPEKTKYVLGSEIDFAGMTVTAVYSDGSTRALEAGDYAVDKTTADVAGKAVKITVSYREKTGSFDITVGELVSISITKPTKTVYTVGEKLDTAGMVVYANYSNGIESEDVTEMAVCQPIEFTEAGQIEVTVTYGDLGVGLIVTGTFPVTVVEAVTP